jgi:chemotaxis protein MotB
MSEHKKAAEAEEHGESAPLWIISFADLVTLTLSFFVILACGTPKKAGGDSEFTEVAAGVKMAFDYVPSPDSTDPIDIAILRRMTGSGDYPKDGDTNEKIDGVMGRSDLVKTIRTGTQTTIGGPIPFAKDSAEITPGAARILEQIARMIRGYANVFFVKGHTSRDEEVSLATARRDLAYERALAVASKLVALGVAKESLRVQSCRDYEPLKEGTYTDATRAVNRRAEVFATESLVSEFRGQPTRTESRPASQPGATSSSSPAAPGH